MSSEDEEYDEELEEEVEENEENEEALGNKDDDDDDDDDDDTSHRNNTANQDTTPKKPFEGTLSMMVGGAAGPDPITVKFDPDSHLPRWLRYLCTDDTYWFDKTLAAVDVADRAQQFNLTFSLKSDGSDPPVYYLRPTAGAGGGGGGGGGGGADAQDEEQEENDEKEEDEEEENEHDDEDEEDAVAEEGNENEEEDTSGQTDEVVIDAVVLAALFSPQTLKKWILVDRNVSLATAIDFVRRTQRDICPVYDAIVGCNTHTPRRLDINWLMRELSTMFVHSKKTAAITRKLHMVLGNKQFTIAKPIDSSLLTTLPAIEAYVEILLKMPRSQLQSWTKPADPSMDDDGDGDGQGGDGGGGEDDQDENTEPKIPVILWLASVVLDIRRRMARQRVGKPPARLPAVEVHARYFPLLKTQAAAAAEMIENAGGDQPPRAVMEEAQGSEDPSVCDPIVAPTWKTSVDGSPLPPLYASDIALLVLGSARMPANDTSTASFEHMLRRKLSIERDSRQPTSSFAVLLWHAAVRNGILQKEATSVLIQHSPKHWFDAATGPIMCSNANNSDEWVSMAFPSREESEEVEENVDVGDDDTDGITLSIQSSPMNEDQMLLNGFCRRFGGFFFERIHETRPVVSDAFFKHISEMADQLEATRIRINQPDQVGSTHEDEHQQLVAPLVQYAERYGADSLVNPTSLHAALSGSNLAAAEWIIRKGCTEVLLPGHQHPIGCLDYAITTGQIGLAKHLIQLGANIDARLSCNERVTALGGLAFENFSDDFEQLLSVWNEKQHEYMTDPVLKMGLLRASPA